MRRGAGTSASLTGGGCSRLRAARRLRISWLMERLLSFKRHTAIGPCAPLSPYACIPSCELAASPRCPDLLAPGRHLADRAALRRRYAGNAACERRACADKWLQRCAEAVQRKDCEWPR